MASATKRDGQLVEGAVVRGDAFAIEREVKIDPSAVLSQATLRIGALRGGPATITKTVTPTPSADGVISEDGSEYRGVAVVSFALTSANTLSLSAGTRYEYDMRYTTVDGAVLTWETGSFVVIDRIT